MGLERAKEGTNSVQVLKEMTQELSRLSYDVDVDYATKINICEQFNRKYSGRSVELIGEAGGVMPGSEREAILIVAFHELDSRMGFSIWALVEFPQYSYGDGDKQWSAGDSIKMNCRMKYVCMHSTFDSVFTVVCSPA